MTESVPGPGRFFVPGLVLLGLIAVVAVWLTRPEPRPEPEVKVAPGPVRPPGIVASRPLGLTGSSTQVAELAIDGRTGKWSVTGQLGSDDERERAMNAVSTALGPSWQGELVVSATTLKAPWLDGLDRALGSLRALKVRATLYGETVTVEGQVSAAERRKALEAMSEAWDRRVLVVWQDAAGPG